MISERARTIATMERPEIAVNICDFMAVVKVPPYASSWQEHCVAIEAKRYVQNSAWSNK